MHIILPMKGIEMLLLKYEPSNVIVMTILPIQENDTQLNR